MQSSGPIFPTVVSGQTCHEKTHSFPSLKHKLSQKVNSLLAFMILANAANEMRQWTRRGSSFDNAIIYPGFRILVQRTLRAKPRPVPVP
jgi:hypothetical protein